MNYWKIVIGLGVVLGIYFFKKISPKHLKFIFIGLSISLALPYFEKQEITNVGYFGFGIFSLLYLIHCLIKKSTLNIIISLFSFFLMYIGFPFANERKLMMIIPIITYIIVLKKIKQFENEISILTLLTSYGLVELMNLQLE